jgi:hypothetical protein
MTEELNFDGPSEDLDVFECPKCKETIDTSSDVCRFCGAKVDHEAAKKAAHLLANVDQALSDASYLRNTAALALILCAGVVFALLRGSARSGRVIVQIGIQNILLGLCALFIVCSLPFPFWSMRWWTKYARLPSDDEDFQSARVAVRTTGYAAVVALAASGVIVCLVLIFRITHG